MPLLCTTCYVITNDGWATPLLCTTCYVITNDWMGNATVVYDLLRHYKCHCCVRLVTSLQMMDGQRHCCVRLVTSLQMIGWATPLLCTTCYVITNDWMGNATVVYDLLRHYKCHCCVRLVTSLQMMDGQRHCCVRLVTSLQMAGIIKFWEM